MPSDLFQQMAKSQLELLANSLIVSDPGSNGNNASSLSTKKVDSMALYLPQENVHSGQLEFTPVVLYPDPKTERVFIASDADSGKAPTLPKTLTKLPGFSHAASLIPGYPMLNAQSVQPGVGVVEEVLCDPRQTNANHAAALSVPLLSGSQTVGVLLVSPALSTTTASSSSSSSSSSWWTDLDREQVSHAAQSLSMALSMDNERTYLREQNNKFRDGLSDSLHQVKNPLQALRTYGKILQRQIMDEATQVGGADGCDDNDDGGESSMYKKSRMSTPLPELIERLMVQSDRVVDLMVPMDTLVHSLEDTNYLALNPAPDIPQLSAAPELDLVKWKESPPQLSWENETIEFARTNGTNSISKDVRESHQEQRQRPSASYDFRSSNSTRTSSNSDSDTIRPQAQSIQESPAPVSLSKEAASLESSPSPSSPSSHTTVIGETEQIEMTFLADVLDPIFSAFEAMAMERKIHFEILGEDKLDELPGVLASPKCVQEAVSNVLDNAFNYVVLPKAGSPFTKNPSPKVRIRLLPNNSAETPGVTLFVEDNGPGINDDEKESIFGRGYRSESSCDSVDGTGLGLDISRTLIKRMDATLSVASEEDYAIFADDDDHDEAFLDGAVLKFQFFRIPKER